MKLELWLTLIFVAVVVRTSCAVRECWY